MDEKLHQGDLYDYYGALLKENHRRIFEAYVCDDLSLSEIAENEGISRQGVHDMIKRDTKLLEEYDEALSLIEKAGRIRDIADGIVRTSADDKVRADALRIIEELQA